MANIYRKLLGLPNVYDLDSKEEERIRYMRTPWMLRTTYGIFDRTSVEFIKKLTHWSKWRYGD